MAVTNPLIVRLSDVHLDMASDAGMVNILRGVSLDIGAGEIAAVVGPSGAGKSSLMMVVGASSALRPALSKWRAAISGRSATMPARDCAAIISGSSSRAFTSFPP